MLTTVSLFLPGTPLFSLVFDVWKVKVVRVFVPASLIPITLYAPLDALVALAMEKVHFNLPGEMTLLVATLSS